MYSLRVFYTRCYLQLEIEPTQSNVIYTKLKKRGTPKVKIKTETRTEIKYEGNWITCACFYKFCVNKIKWYNFIFISSLDFFIHLRVENIINRCKKAIRNISITNCIMKTHISFSRKSLKQYYLTFPHLHRKLKLVTYLHFAPSFYITSSDRYSFCYNIWSLLSRTSTYLTKNHPKGTTVCNIYHMRDHNTQKTVWLVYQTMI